MILHYKATCWVSMKFNSEITKEELIERLEAGELPLDIGNTEEEFIIYKNQNNE